MKRYTFYLLPLLLACGACDKFFALDTDDTLSEEQHYTELAELNSAFLGVPATFRDVLDHTIIISELLGDLMTPTTNAGDDYWDIFNYAVKDNNHAASPAPYYRTIIACNDFIRHALAFYEKSPGLIAENTFHSMLAEVFRYRIWCYLTLGKLYNEAVYFDYSISDKIDLKNCPVLNLDQIVEQSILMMEQGVMGIDLNLKLDWLLVIKGTTDAWNYMGINPQALLGELYLWGGRYRDALYTLMGLVNSNTRYAMPLLSSPASTWKSNLNNNASTEMVSVLSYNASYGQKNMLPYYFSNVYPNLYYFAPTTWMSELFRNSPTTGTEIRTRSTVGEEGGSRVITKYHTTGSPSREYNTAIPIYRVADIYLMIAEVHNKLKFFGEKVGDDTEPRDIAMCFINNGLKTWWQSSTSSFKQPFGNTALYSTNLQTNAGVRGRVTSSNINWRILLPSNPTEEQTMRLIDSLIVNETALECAYEGKRWFTLLRMARYWDDPAFLAAIVSRKGTSDANREATRQALMDRNRWFIKYEHLKAIE
jgi:hypothetical protein